MHAEDIKAEIRKRGLTQADLARHLGVHAVVVSAVIHGRVTSNAVAQSISRVVGLPVSKLWPGRYDRRPANLEQLLPAGSVRVKARKAA